MTFNNEVLENIWKDRYCKNNESLDDNLRRVAKYCSKNKKEEKLFYNLMNNGLFFPGGRTMSNSGIGKALTLNNCFTSPLIRDELSDIFDKVKLGSITHQRGGGIGYNFSQLRPKGSPTSNDAVASGAISFMDVFNAQTATILQGNRRGANMGLMCIYCMDIEDFINAKSYEEGKLDHFNVTVIVDDDFINAVKSDTNITLHYPVYDEDGFILKDESQWIYKKEISARYLWDLIIQKAYSNGEPGIAYCDTMNKDNNLWYIENIVATNPCFEYLSGTVYGNHPKTKEKLNPNEYGGACNLGSLFLHNYVQFPFTPNAYLNFDRLREAIELAVRFLDNIIDINTFPDKIYENYQKSFRTIGLGVTGLADMLCMLNLKYTDKEAQDYVYDLMNFIAFNAYKSSIALAKEKGEFPYLDREAYIQSGYLRKHVEKHQEWQEIIDDIKKYGIRNAKIMSIAPVGTLSLTFGNNCSSGIEPIFSLSYDRKVKFGGQSEENAKIIKMEDYAYSLWNNTKENNIVDKSVFVTAMEMGVDDHINMLSKIAFHVDMSVSKTINVPSDYSYEDTKNIYMKCWEKGIKGCTIFRPNAIRQGVLISNEDEKKETEVGVKLSRGDIIEVNDDVIGKKRKLMSGCGSLHCSAFFDPITGDLLETYLSKGSLGGCQNFMVGLSRMISLSARSGCNIYTIVDQLNSCGACPSYAVRRATKGDTSKGSCCPMSIGNALIDMYNEVQDELGLNKTTSKETNNTDVEISTMPEALNFVCPQCGEKAMVYEGGCNSCHSCGYSHCG